MTDEPPIPERSVRDSDLDLDLPSLSPSQEVLMTAFSDGKSLAEASAIAYPESARPMELALKLIDENDFVKARFHLYMDEVNISDRDIAIKLARAFQLAEENPKASTAMLNATKFAADLKNLIPAKNSPNAEIVAPITFLTQQQTVNNFMETAKEHISDEIIDNLVDDDDIIVIETIPKDTLFDD